MKTFLLHPTVSKVIRLLLYAVLKGKFICSKPVYPCPGLEQNHFF